MTGDAQKAVVLVVDTLALRCAGITTLINEWVSPLGKSAHAIEPENIGFYSQPGNIVSLIVLNIGGSSLHDLQTRAVLRSVREQFPTTPCAILSDRTEAEEAVGAVSFGFQAFISTTTPLAVVHQALAFIMNGGAYFPREALLEIADGRDRARHHSGAATGSGLTPAAEPVLDRLRSGKSNKLIARELDMQESTVKVHVRQIMSKLGATNRTQVAIMALMKGDHATGGPEPALA
ncbi:response regulator transcription factor [Mesorhizobium sp. UC22_110]|uniref:response regulator transcription factor n=1 Tax=Mesorhizobium sp. UC22_110 TaxID=3374552 RepID=UPI003757B6DF